MNLISAILLAPPTDSLEQRRLRVRIGPEFNQDYHHQKEYTPLVVHLNKAKSGFNLKAYNKGHPNNIGFGRPRNCWGVDKDIPLSTSGLSLNPSFPKFYVPFGERSLV